jgi:hypothetical protein
MKMLALAATVVAAISASAAMAASGSYSGNWPAKVKMPSHFANTACLSLTDNGTDGSPHSGPVSSSGDMTGELSGAFQVVNGLLVVNLQAGSDNGEVYYLSFIAPAKDGRIVGKGVFNDPGSFPVEPLVFGEKGGC